MTLWKGFMKVDVLCYVILVQGKTNPLNGLSCVSCLDFFWREKERKRKVWNGTCTCACIGHGCSWNLVWLLFISCSCWFLFPVLEAFWGLFCGLVQGRSVQSSQPGGLRSCWWYYEEEDGVHEGMHCCLEMSCALRQSEVLVIELGSQLDDLCSLWSFEFSTGEGCWVNSEFDGFLSS